MPVSAPPTDPAAQLQWLVDRAALGDVLVEFARALDDQDWAAYAALYAEDGTLSVPPDVRHSGRAGLTEMVERSLGRFAGTYHLTGNFAFDITGDTARSRSYLMAAHVFDATEPFRHADGAGWYENTYRRTPEGWRITSVQLTIRMVSGEPLPAMEPAGR